MGLLSIFKRHTDSSAGAAASVSEPGDAVQRARTRARQRLIGAIVLVGIGIVGFPLVFETQPRPIPVDIPIEVPRKDGAPSLAMPAARGPAVAPSGAARSRADSAPTLAAAAGDVITETPEEAGRDVTTPGSAAPATASPAGRSAATKPPETKSQAAATTELPAAPKAASRPSGKASAAPSATSNVSPAPATRAATDAAPTAKATAADPAPAVSDATRARALLEGKPPATEAGRFVVQVGAFADANAAHEMRLKAEKLGLKTYTQVATSAAGKRIRVRLGPFATRDDADKALAKARGAGLAGVVMPI